MSNPVNDYHTFNNSLDNYSLQYPSDWKLDSSNTTIYLTKGGAEVKGQSEPIAPNTTLEEYVYSQTPVPNRVYYSSRVAVGLKQADITFKGLPAKNVTYSWMWVNGGRSPTEKQFLYFIRGDRIYTVSYIANYPEFYDFHSAAQKIIDSLTFNT